MAVDFSQCPDERIAMLAADLTIFVPMLRPIPCSSYFLAFPAAAAHSMFRVPFGSGARRGEVSRRKSCTAQTPF